MQPGTATQSSASTALRLGLLLTLLAALCLLAPGRAHAASASALFTKGYNDFHSLDDNAKKSMYRSEWMRVEREFAAVLQRDPKGSYAPKALYYLGRVYEELGSRSGLSSDFRKADDYFGRVLTRFPSHGWADDCLFRRAEIRIRRLNMVTYGKRDLERILDDYAKSDMAPRAAERLAELNGDAAPQPTLQKTTTKREESPRPMEAPQAEARDPRNMAHLNEIRYTSSSEYTRVVLDLDEQVPYRYQLLAPNAKMNRPHRLYIDLSGSQLGNDIHRNVVVSDGILRSIRSGQYDKDTARVVLDFHSLQDYKVFPLDNPFRIVVDVYSPEGTKDADTADAEPQGKEVRLTSDKAGNPAKYKAPSGSKSMAGDLVEQLGLTVHTIMVDAGHGGKDPGTHGHGLVEKDVNLAFAKRLGKMLTEKGFQVIYTRSTDVFVPLEERTAQANVKKVDLFISIHCNAHHDSAVHGLETYSLNLARSKDAVRVAARENAVDPKRISDLQVILTDLMLSSKLKESTDLAVGVQSRTVASVRRKWQITDHGHREAPFYVLMGAKMPAILVELGYLTNKTEAAHLTTDAYRQYLAEGIVQGVLGYKHQIERFAGI